MMILDANKGSPGMGRRRPDREVLEERRLEGRPAVRQGRAPSRGGAPVGRVHSTCLWRRACAAEGARGLKQAERAGRPPLLTKTTLAASTTPPIWNSLADYRAYELLLLRIKIHEQIIQAFRQGWMCEGGSS
jgi:hypothetical protein